MLFFVALIELNIIIVVFLFFRRLENRQSVNLCGVAIMILAIDFIDCYPGILAWEALVERAW